MKFISLLLVMLVHLSSSVFAQHSPMFNLKIELEKVGYQPEKSVKKNDINGPALYKWDELIESVTKFKRPLKDLPLKKGYNAGLITGLIYFKSDGIYCSLSIVGVMEVEGTKSSDAYSIVSVKSFKIPKTDKPDDSYHTFSKFELSLSKNSGFQKCTISIYQKKPRNNNQDQQK